MTTLLKGLKIYDGLGSSSFVGNILIKDTKIAGVLSADVKTDTVIDMTGFSVAPGFIDAQNHSDMSGSLFDNLLDNFLRQGYTTISVGNCGASLAPIIGPSSILSFRKWKNLQGLNLAWQSFEEYAKYFKDKNFATNIVSLVGYSTVRRGFVGDQIRALTDEEMRSVLFVVEKAFEQGAFGVSFGLEYAHEHMVLGKEMEVVLQKIQERGLLASIHLRNEAQSFALAAHEAIDLVIKTKVRTKISHLKVKDKALVPDLVNVLHEAENMYQRGYELFFDAYPYTTMWQPLYSMLPTYVTDGGRVSLLKSLQDPLLRARVVSEVSRIPKLDSVVITSNSGGIGKVGMTLAELANRTGKSFADSFVDLIEQSSPDLMGILECIPEDSMKAVVHHPLVCIATDGVGRSVSGEMHHERSTNTSFRFLRMARNEGEDLTFAITKLTSLPARAIGLSSRGVIRQGMMADLVIFDEDALIGPKYVFMSGQLVLKEQDIISKGKFLLNYDQDK